VEPRNPVEVTALNAAPGEVHLVFTDELTSTSSTGAMSAIGQKRTSTNEALSGLRLKCSVIWNCLLTGPLERRIGRHLNSLFTSSCCCLLRLAPKTDTSDHTSFP